MLEQYRLMQLEGCGQAGDEQDKPDDCQHKEKQGSKLEPSKFKSL
jgi:hypothetical protein